MAGDVPPARQCTMPSCEREAIDPLGRDRLCRSCLDSLDDPEPANPGACSPEEADSPGENPGCNAGKSASASDGRDDQEAAADLDDVDDSVGADVDRAPVLPGASAEGPADLGSVDPDTYPEDKVEDGALWMHWQLPVGDDRKVPRNTAWGSDADGQYAHVGAKDPRAWVEFDEARRWLEHDDDLGLGYYLVSPDRDDWDEENEGDKYDWVDPAEDVPDEEHVGLFDFDDIRDPETGAIAPRARPLLQECARAGAFCEWSPSGEGAHGLGGFRLPDGVDALTIDLSSPEWPDAELEIYPGRRYTTITGDHIPGTSTTTGDLQAVVDALADANPGAVERARASDPDRPEKLDVEPARSRDELADVETTDDVRDVYDAIQHVRPSDIRLRSPVTEERADGSKSLDPSWASSSSGTRLAEVGDGWVYRKGMHGLDALQVVALEERIITDVTDYPEGEAFREAVDALRDRGAHIPEYEGPVGSLDPVTALPLEEFAQREPHEARRYARRRGLEWPTDDELGEQIRDAVEDTLADEGYRVIQAPTGSNKTGVAAETRWRDVDDETTGGRPVVLFCETTDARDEAVERARAADLDLLVLKGHQELCPVARGEYDPANIDDEADTQPVVIDSEPGGEWFGTQVFGKGLSISAAHAEAEYRYMGELPCCAGERECRTKTQYPSDGLVDEDGPRYDLVIATDPFAFVPSLRQDTNILHDEQPSYTEEFGLESPDADAITDRVRRAVTGFLQLSDAGPDTFEALVELARRCARCDAPYWNEHAAPEERPPDDLAEQWSAVFDALEYDPERRWYFNDPRAHALAPALARAIWTAIATPGPNTDPDERGAGVFDQNGRASATVQHNPPRLDEDAGDGAGWNRTHVTIVITDENTVRRVRNVPDFETARSVVGLDARPDPWLWQRNVAPEIDVERVLEPEVARRWRRFERGQTVVQAGTATRPAGRDGQYYNERHARAFFDRLREFGGDDFRAAGGPKKVEPAMRETMREVGVPADDLASMHYGAEKSRNDFADETIGAVYMCIDPGDDYVLDTLAECGLDAAPERSAEPCDGCAGAGCHKCDGTGQKRAHGREFVGPDAQHAAAILESVRGTHVAQMVGRFGRDLDVENGETNLTVVATDVVPPDLVDYRAPGVEWAETDLQGDIYDALEANPHSSARDLADAVGCSKQHVTQFLGTLEEREDAPVTRQPGAGEWGADLWLAEADADLGDVQLGLDEIGNAPYREQSTWSLSITPVGRVFAPRLARHARSAPRDRASSGGVPPPDGVD